MIPCAVIVAGGAGVRFGGPKHRQLLGGVELWKHSVVAFLAAGIADVIVVGDVPGGIPGGERRQDSVVAGLGGVPDTADWVLVHDAARALVSSRLIERVLTRAAVGDVDGVIPAVPVTDTVKRVRGESVTETVDRSDLVVVQTPQAFRLDVLKAAHVGGAMDATDDAALVERAGGTVVHVMGDPSNIKITYPSDLATAETLLGLAGADE